MKKIISKIENMGLTKIEKKEKCTHSIGGCLEIEEIVYLLEDGSLGHNVLPVVDRSASFRDQGYNNYPVERELAGDIVKGSEEVDKFIRKSLGLNEEERFCALLSYFHPENYQISFQEIGSKKTEFSITHNGLYLGEGMTRNSPFDYHGQRFEIKGYPALLSTIELNGVPNRVLMENLYKWTRLLNESNGGVNFPSEYKKDPFHLISLNALGTHLRAMLDNEWINEEISKEKPFIEIIEECDLLKLYCAEHMWQILNTALNIPINERGFVEFFGEEVGRKLFTNAKILWTTLDPNSVELFETEYFEPLWKKEEVLDPYNLQTIGKGLYCSPQTNADLVRDLSKVFAPWHQMGPSYTISLLIGFMEEFQQRLGLPVSILMKDLSGAIRQISEYYLKTVDLKADKYKEELCKDVSMITKLDIAKVQQFLDLALINISDGREIMSLEKAYQEFEIVQIDLMKKLRDVEPAFSLNELIEKTLAGENVGHLVKHYNPPATLHKITTGLVSSSTHVTIKTIATLMDIDDVEVKNNFQNHQASEVLVETSRK